MYQEIFWLGMIALLAIAIALRSSEAERPRRPELAARRTKLFCKFCQPRVRAEVPLQQLAWPSYASAAGPGPLAPSRSMTLLRTTLAFAASALLGGAGAAAGSGGGADAAGAETAAAKPNLIFILAVRGRSPAHHRPR